MSELSDELADLLREIADELDRGEQPRSSLRSMFVEEIVERVLDELGTQPEPSTVETHIHHHHHYPPPVYPTTVHPFTTWPPSPNGHMYTVKFS